MTIIKTLDTKSLRNNEQYKAMIVRIESYINIGEGDLYVQLIAELNRIIDKYRNLLAQRKGRANAKKEDSNSVKE